MNISATIITLNEEKNIDDCLACLDWVSEIIVVDSGSTDRTREICCAYPNVQFHDHPWEGFGRQKNLAASLAGSEWVLNIDADERVSAELKASIVSAGFDGVDGFRVARENYFGKRRIKYCGWYPDYNIRLYNRRRCSFGERAVHEAVECNGEIGTLNGNLIHHTYADISDYLIRMERYSTLAACQMIADGRQPGMIDVIVRPFFTFIKMYLLKRGLLEGYMGFVLSCLYAVYTFCKYAKSREMLKSER
jgi:glycosyltransferase involved in cell wall biosynthesis